MPGTTLTTKEVARLLSVSEATVKRWADDGLIQSDKTAGGHRRFGLSTIARFQRERGAAPEGAQTSGVGDKKSSRESLSPALLLSQLIQGDEEETGALLIDAYLHGESLVSLFDRVITPAMHQVGELWCSGKLTITDEHLATQTALAALQKLRGLIHVPPPTETRALVCGIEGDLHELPVHLVHALLEGEGWEVINLGPNTPFFALAETLPRHRPQLLCIAAKLLTDPDRLARDYAHVQKVANKMHCAVALGGDALSDRRVRDRFPSDFYAENFEQLLGFARSLVHEGS
jgi:excisionase family DNA binding protein